jgi:hypothetical protein
MTTTAIVTGAGTGFGLALTRGLAERGVAVIACARDAAGPARSRACPVLAVPGDVNDPATTRRRRGGGSHRPARAQRGRARPSPLPTCPPLPELRAVLGQPCSPRPATQLALPAPCRGRHGRDAQPDAAVEATRGGGWRGRGRADHYAAVLIVEEPAWPLRLRPGDMRTAMHQRAFPGEDISDRPDPRRPGVPAAGRRATGERPLPGGRPAGRSPS